MLSVSLYILYCIASTHLYLNLRLGQGLFRADVHNDGDRMMACMKCWGEWTIACQLDTGAVLEQFIGLESNDTGTVQRLDCRESAQVLLLASHCKPLKS